MESQELLDRYLDAVIEEGLALTQARLRCYLDFLFDGISLEGASVLDIGAGSGMFGFYARCAGAARVVCLEPLASGSRAVDPRQGDRLAGRLGLRDVRIEPTTLQAFDPRGAVFDVLLLHDSINHLDEEACVALGHDDDAAARYQAILAKLARLAKVGAALIVTDCSPRNVFPLLHVRNPFLPEMEWHKHQTPETWARLLSRAGFSQPRIRWRSPGPLGRGGRLLLGNRVAAFFLLSHFRLAMIRAQDGPAGD